ncbi:hypothetical protein [Leifsonia shinshuensis]|uniref:hypothetical protein n=1 Tax=Leifsonia shinshuensis TaxID=150026 RepID=UPI0028672D62|nr:hypothetical protein [Leifsonia shinshuensis]MDR6969994.1 hypothetical protein [Leifsonia shinshuensis]
MTTTTSTPYQTVAPVRTLSITSFVLGAASIVFGWTLIAPIAGLVVGVLALGREPEGCTWAIWGIVLNAVMLAGVLLVALLALIGIGIGFAALPLAWL